MIYDFDRLPDRRNTECAKWHVYGEDVLPMWLADMDFLSPQPVIQALHERIDHGVFGYPQMCDPELTEIIIERMQKLYNWEVKPEEVILLPGVVTGFNLAVHAFVQPQESLLIQSPIYPPIWNSAETTGRNCINSPLKRGADGSYTIDFDAFEAAIRPDTRLFLLCNPHNPVGRVFRKDELEKLAEICLRHDLVICSDEIHNDLIFPGHPHTPIASIRPEISQHSVTLMAPSKTFNIAGLEASFAIIQNAELRKRYRQAQQGLVGGVNLVGQVAAITAYRDGQEWLTQVLHYLDDNRRFLCDYVAKNLPGLKLTPPEGTYLAWIDCRESPIEGSPAKFFLKNARVAMNDGADFGEGGEGFVRLNFGCPRSMLTEALERMRHALMQLPTADLEITTSGG